MTRFADRTSAGRLLAERVCALALRSPVVLGLPRGGIPVAAEVAAALGAPLDVFVARKVGAPGREELGIGAVAEGLETVVVTATAAALGLRAAEVERLAQRARAELARRVIAYRGDRPLPPLAGRDIILIDDGLATGVTAEAALRALSSRGAREVVLAVPVAAEETVRRLSRLASRVVCLEMPADFVAVGYWYADFSQVSDEEVVAILDRFASTVIAADGVRLAADFTFAGPGRPLVVFAHGSGSSRTSPRNRQVAHVLSSAGLSTLLLDLLTPDEEARLRFDVPLLAGRLVAAVRWVDTESPAAGVPLGYFGASTGAAAALVAAAGQGPRIGAVVSRGGRPDLAGSLLSEVVAPTLLVVGGRDEEVLALNRQALERLGGERRLDVVPGATHLFEEPGALDEVARLAAEWFLRYLERSPGHAER